MIYGKWTFVDRSAANGSIARGQDLTSAALSADSISVEVKCDDPAITVFAKDAPMTYYHKDRQLGMYYLQSVTQVSPSHYRLSGLSAVGLLAVLIQPGGIYTGQSVETVVREICGPVNVFIKSNLKDMKLYGWLPYAKPPFRSARDNLAEVLFAIGASLGTDLNGVLRVEPLWNGVSSTVSPSRMYLGGSVSYSDPVSAVTVTEHQYVQGTEERELFSGVAQAGDMITFDEPMHSLTATGFTIQASGANWARLSAGTGSLMGKSYVHSTRQVTEIVTPGAAENIKAVTDATLVSMANSVAVAKRLADYYRCAETIKTPVVAGAEKPGHVVSIYHPYAKTYVDACISNADDMMSATIKSNLTALVGFLPPQTDDAQYFDRSVVLTGNQAWVVPDGATAIRAVLIGGGQGGWSGLSGENVMQAVSHGDGTINGNTRHFATGDISKFALGGNPGAPGKGGKILQFTMDVFPGQQLAAVIGTGGSGGVAVWGSMSMAGSDGGATTFAGRSSDEGTPNEGGYIDEITGAQYAAPGGDGAKGGNGAGTNEAGTEEVPAESVTAFGQTFSGGENSTDQYLEDEAGSANLGRGYKYAEAYGGYGGGAAYGADGAKGGSPITAQALSARVSARGGSGGTGASALPPPIPTMHGRGGYGGNGGGAAGSPGPCLAENIIGPEATGGASIDVQGSAGNGGKGSDGGRGADGCVIIYYRLARNYGHGPFVTADKKSFLDGLNRRFIV